MKTSKDIVAPKTVTSDGRIFISYRRDDTQWAAGRLSDSLSAYFGDGRVFRDIDGISGGAEFAKVIQSSLGSADATLVLIGKNWLSVTDDSGGRRLDNPNDWIVREIATTLEKQIPIYPVLVDGTPMPRADELPDVLRPLVRFNAISLNDDRWNTDVARLARIIALDVPSAAEKVLHRLNLGISFMLFSAILFTMIVVFWKATINQPLNELLSLGLSGVIFMAIIPSTALLFVYARSVDKSKQWYFRASAWTGAIGAAASFIALAPIPGPQEPNAMFLGSMVTATLMFVFMSLSGFRAK